MATTPAMVRFFTQMCPMTTVQPYTHILSTHRCWAVTKGKLVPMDPSFKPVHQSRPFADKPGDKGPKKEEQIEKIKMPGFIHPETIKEEGYFTQKAHQQIEELKKKIEKPIAENTEKKD